MTYILANQLKSLPSVILKLINNNLKSCRTISQNHMGKRLTGVGKNKKSHSHKTKKRLAIKKAKLAARKKKR